MNSVVAADAPVVQAPSQDFFLARQPILGRDQQLVAYELLFRNVGSTEAGVLDDVAATAAVIAHASQLGLEQVVGQLLAFVNVDAVVLQSDFIRFLPNDKVILEILETVEATAEVIARVQELKAVGFKFALDDVVRDSTDVRHFLPLVDVIKVDLQGVQPGQLVSLSRALKATHKKLLAEKVETMAEFQACLALGFDYFQGYYFARPVILSGRKIAPAELMIMRVLDQINSDADNSAIEHSIKHDALISLNLLRLVNTAAAGARTHIDSVAQALMVLGRRQLQRWLQILLYAKPGKTLELGAPLLQMAITRGKLLELMTLQVRPRQRASAEIGFTVGMLSLMDTLFSMAMTEVLQTMVVTDEVRAALLERTGEFGAMLRVVEMLERLAPVADLSDTLRELSLTPSQLSAMQLESFEWVNDLTSQR